MLYFLRHALDDERYVGSWSDVGILESEKENVKQTGLYIRNNIPIKNIISSDIVRAKQTAEIIGNELKLPVALDQNLREQNKGTLTGRLRESLTPEERILIDHQQIDTKYQNGETLLDVYKRIKAYLDTINKYPDNTLIVTHRGVINMIYYILEDIPLDMDKKRFSCSHLSLHEYDINKRLIRRIK